MLGNDDEYVSQIRFDDQPDDPRPFAQVTVDSKIQQLLRVAIRTSYGAVITDVRWRQTTVKSNKMCCHISPTVSDSPK